MTIVHEGVVLVPSLTEFNAADRIRDESGCVLRWQRTFMRPVLESHSG